MAKNEASLTSFPRDAVLTITRVGELGRADAKRKEMQGGVPLGEGATTRISLLLSSSRALGKEFSSLGADVWQVAVCCGPGQTEDFSQREASGSCNCAA
jgi:hypothetical protein